MTDLRKIAELRRAANAKPAGGRGYRIVATWEALAEVVEAARDVVARAESDDGWPDGAGCDVDELRAALAKLEAV